jgi:Rrf2 family transcriptional regulator, iron-sulfur cluster assembly transcription factor
MIYSNACEYAIRALIHLARHEGEFTKLRLVAETEAIPYAFLASISQRLVASGLLESARGPTGGYVLARPAAEVTLYQIKEIVDGVEELAECAVGLGRCSDEVPCPLHDTWKPLRRQIELYLRSTTLADMAEAMDRNPPLRNSLRSLIPSPSGRHGGR